VQELAGGKVNGSSGAHWASGSESYSVRSLGRERVALCIPLFLYILLVSGGVVLFASFAILLNCPYPDPRVLPFSSHSPLHPSRGRGDRADTWFFVAHWGYITTPLCDKRRRLSQSYMFKDNLGMF